MDDQLLKGPDLAIPTELQEQYLQHLHEQMSLVVPYQLPPVTVHLTQRVAVVITVNHHHGATAQTLALHHPAF